MITLRRAVLGTFAAAGLALAPAATAAPADGPEPAEPQPASSMLTLTVQEENSARNNSALLLCDPAGGTHGSPDKACSALHKAGGKLDTLAGDNMRCTLEYSPVTATATGDWNGEPVRFQQEYPNLCALHAETGEIFKF